MVIKRYKYTDFRPSDREDLNSSYGFTIPLPSGDIITDTAEG